MDIAMLSTLCRRALLVCRLRLTLGPCHMWLPRQVLRMNHSRFENGSWTVFMDDPVRVLRGVRFALQFGLEVEPETLAQMRRCMSLCRKTGAGKWGAGRGAGQADKNRGKECVCEAGGGRQQGRRSENCRGD